MSRCITGTCPHERGVFIWLADGPWRGDPADPDSAATRGSTTQP